MIKTTLVGLGQIGIGYDFKEGKYQDTAKSHVGAMLKLPDVKLVNLVDIAPVKSVDDDFLLSTLFCDFKTFASTHRKYDLLIVATPTETHLRVVLDLLERHQFNFVILEKPCGRNLSECEVILDELEKKSINWQVNYFRSALPNTLKAVERVISFGEEPTSAEIYGYGESLNIISHFLHLLTLFVPAESMQISEIKLVSGLPTIFFSSDFKLTVMNIGGFRRDEPILSVLFPSYNLKFRKNGELVEFRSNRTGQIIDLLRETSFENYQELATHTFLSRFKSGLSGSRHKIQKVHELVSKIESLHG